MNSKVDGRVKTGKHCSNFQKNCSECQKLQAGDVDINSRQNSRTCYQMASL